MATTVYSPHKIRSGYGEFRLLHIDPSRDNDAPLQGHLTVAALRDRPIYSTLSYCWGDQTDKTSLELDSFTLPISRNLEKALKSFRALDGRDIWVDQVCINQQDVTERADQVLMMRDVYAGSQKCFVYLGENVHDPQSLADLIAYIRSHRGDSGWMGQLQEMTHYFGKGEGGNEQQNNPDLKDPQAGWKKWRDCIFDIISQAYFSRIWVLQEILFSKKIQCLWGDCVFDWDIIESLAKHLPIRESLSATPAFKELPILFSWSSDVVHDINADMSGRKIDRANALEQFSSFIEIMDFLRKGKSLDMCTLLISSRGFKATDPRDKAFALLNLASDREDFPNADYTWSVEKVYRRFARSIIRQGGDISVLSVAGLQVSAVFESSWVPDWRQVSLLWNFQRKSQFCAGGKQQDGLEETESRGLIVPAHKLDEIRLVCAFDVNDTSLISKLTKCVVDASHRIIEERLTGWSDPLFLQGSLISLLFCDYDGITQSIDERNARNDLGKLKARHLVDILTQVGEEKKAKRNLDKNKAGDLIDTLTQDLFDTKSFTSFTLSEGWEIATHYLTQDLAKPLRTGRNLYLAKLPLEERIAKNIASALRGEGIDYVKFLNTMEKSTRIIVTRDGRLGLAPSLAVAGDVVAIIQGAKAPFVLRPCGGRRRFKVVGQAYIRGVMFGEALEEKRVHFKSFEII